MMASPPIARALRATFRAEWTPEVGGTTARGFFAGDPRVRTLLRVLLSYPEVRYVVPDRISLDAGAGPALMETIARFLERQSWLVERVVIA